jgi:hypothetical protein
MKFKQELGYLALSFATTAAIVVADRLVNKNYGEIFAETQQNNGEVLVTIKTTEGKMVFSNCNPRILRQQLNGLNKTPVIGKEITYLDLEMACPNDPNILKEAVERYKSEPSK